MKKKQKIGSLVIIFIFIYAVFTAKKVDNDKHFEKLIDRFKIFDEDSNQVVIATVACSLKQFELVVTLVKSAILLSMKDGQHPLKFVIVTEKALYTSFVNRLTEFQKLHKISFVLRKVSFPINANENWKHLGSSQVCASQKLFLPSLLHELDSVLYVSPESIFLSPPHDTFKLLSNFKKSQLVGLAKEESGSVYNREKGHPFYGTNGANSGVMLMNLKKMRKKSWEKSMKELYNEFVSKATYGDQDLINIYLSTRPNEAYELPCENNFRTEHCEKSTECLAPEGIKIFHGNRDALFGAKDIIFRDLHGILEKVKQSSFFASIKLIFSLFSTYSATILVLSFVK